MDLSPVKIERVLLEKDIESAVCRYAKAQGLLAEKFTSPAKRSVPDRIFTTPKGCHFFIEFKAPGKKPTPKQAKDHEDRRARGVAVYVIDNIEQGKAVVDEWVGKC
jgi:hypothetical protein